MPRAADILARLMEAELQTQLPDPEPPDPELRHAEVAQALDFDEEGSDIVSPKDIVRQATTPLPRAGVPDQGYFIRLLSRIQRKRGGYTDRVKLERNTWAILYPHPDYERQKIGIRLYRTDVLTVYADDSCEVDTGGHSTVTTRDRINKYLPDGWGVYTDRETWYWHNRATRFGTWNDPNGIRQEFTSGDKIDGKGVLYAQDPPTYKRRKKPVGGHGGPQPRQPTPRYGDE